MQVTPEKLSSYTNPLTSPHEVGTQVYMISQNGDILIQKEEIKQESSKTDAMQKDKPTDNKVYTLRVEARLGGQPSSIAIERDHTAMYIADMAHQAIMLRPLQQQDQDLCKEFVTEYEGMPFLGPNQVITSDIHIRTLISYVDAIYFTDSGPFGETSIENPKGSVFMVDLEGSDIKAQALAYRCLAHPSGLALSHDEKNLFVSETCENRIIRFVLTNSGIYAFSVYHQFSGRFGPTALVISQSDFLYVARFEFASQNDMGVISVLNPQGQLLENILLPQSPEITGMCFSVVTPTKLYITDNSNSNRLQRCTIPLEDKDEEKKKKDKDSYKVK